MKHRLLRGNDQRGQEPFLTNGGRIIEAMWQARTSSCAMHGARSDPNGGFGCVSPGVFSEELLEKILRAVSVQKYADTVLDMAHAIGVSPTAISPKIVELTAAKLMEFQQRSLETFRPFALFLDTIHRGGEAFLVALGLDMAAEKVALEFSQGSSENQEICKALFRGPGSSGLGILSTDPLRHRWRQGADQSTPGQIRQEAGASALYH